MPSVMFVVTCQAFPSTDAERKSVALEWIKELTEEWFNQGLPSPEVFHVLVHRPGEITRRGVDGQIRATHIRDVAAAREEELGGVAVAVTLTDVIRGAEAFEAWRITRTGP